ncbi:hypothetical protein GF337_11530 [candidate division KSB1 bacterium]|nr:hypothetical protein [candidate division KSB1 bacterium]
MCRMLIAVGDVDIAVVAEDFKIIAGDENEKHENNVDKEFKHGDGWGFAYLENDELVVHKSILPYFDDPGAERIKQIESPFYVLHARKKSDGMGGIRAENAHPFRYSDYIFFHNGTVRENLPFEEKFQPQGETDSERLFYYLLSNVNGNLDEKIIRDKLNRVTEYSGMNSILTDGKISYIINWYVKKPLYYTYKMLVEEDFIIISSEILPVYRGREWQKISNQSIIKLDTVTREYSILNGKEGLN